MAPSSTLARTARAHLWAALLPALALPACTHTQLARSTTAVAGTVMDIEFQMVLDNLARMQSDPATLPSQIRIRQGTVQISDRLGIYQLQVSGDPSGSFGGPRAERTVSEQWGADAITDPLSLKQLQDVYRTAMGLPPMNGAGFLKVERPEPSSSGHSGDKTGDKSSGSDKAYMHVDLSRDVPRGWFHVGTREQVPANASWVSHSGRQWVWVGQDGAAGLSRFTLLVLAIAKLGPGDDNSNYGLMYTGGNEH